MSHKANRQESDRKHSKTPDGNDNVLRLLECIRSGQVEVEQIVAHVVAGEVTAAEVTQGEKK